MKTLIVSWYVILVILILTTLSYPFHQNIHVSVLGYLTLVAYLYVTFKSVEK